MTREPESQPGSVTFAARILDLPDLPGSGRGTFRPAGIVAETRIPKSGGLMPLRKLVGEGCLATPAFDRDGTVIAAATFSSVPPDVFGDREAIPGGVRPAGERISALMRRT